ncbi:GNAT family N-acetyltransferase [Clostridium sp. CF012]|uniref:GNAT family N-acetyltransferase n=1 Tax=Clostridium sp. CF012 TaxID=2843319 RepID=UPI001C0CDB71|nr:GNAT family N-acetyltransferase [Clostridium sp. CF012]MBU3143839.1 GNAT family N-acetyltransferase [Clostridium sp. CF012]
MNICIVEKSIKEIELIKPLWEQLNCVHFKKSIYFKSKFEKFTFDKRVKSIYEKAQTGTIKIDMLWNSETENYVGYCLSSIEDNLGEIESIFIEDQYRKFRLGGKLMESSLSWFELNGITNIQIGVAYSNDEALPFYERYGFYIGNYILKRK